MPLEVHTQTPLDTLSTFQLPARAAELVELTDPSQLSSALDTALPILILGGGSNTVFVDDYPGRVILNRLRGIRVDAGDAQTLIVTAAAGENWHQLVLQTVDQGLWGLENLALIPGSVGAAPMQNIGAYGVELSDCLDAVQVYDRSTQSMIWLSAVDCQLSYRSSRFKTADADRFIILAVRLIVSTRARPRLDYPDLQHAFTDCNRASLQPRSITDAVMHIRRQKLPDPSQVPNAGSFFKNPLVDRTQAEKLLAQYPMLPHWPAGEQVKLSAGWMIDQLGWRGRSVGGAQVYPNHALVLTN
ncbi:MAG: UDP-N-acetylmuramate dehydrogenase, partial [Pseudomonadota bacterium]